MPNKDKSETMTKLKELQTRLERDENFELKIAEQLGDLAGHILRLHERLDKIQLEMENLKQNGNSERTHRDSN